MRRPDHDGLRRRLAVVGHRRGLRPRVDHQRSRRGDAMKSASHDPAMAAPTREPGAGRPAHPLFDRGALQVLLLLMLLFVGPAAAWLTWAPRPTAPASPSPELLALLGSVLLSLALPIVQIAMHLRQRGGDWVRGNREKPAAPGDAAGRAERAHTNLIDSLLPFATVVLVAQASQSFNRYSAVAAVIYLSARAVHAQAMSSASRSSARPLSTPAGWRRSASCRSCGSGRDDCRTRRRRLQRSMRSIVGRYFGARRARRIDSNA